MGRGESRNFAIISISILVNIFLIFCQQDYYANHNGIPRRDEQQDVELLGAEQNGTHTIAQFRRKWKTCDQYYDMPLGVSFFNSYCIPKPEARKKY